MDPAVAVIVAARDEADRLPATLAALDAAFPGARVVVADDGSSDGTADAARAGGAEVVRCDPAVGKGGAATAGARTVAYLAGTPDPPVFVLCDGDLGDSARELPALVAAVREGRCDLAVGAFALRVGGGFGVALRFAGWAIRRRAGLSLAAPISGQRALSGDALRAVLPFADGFGMEIGMTIDAARAGLRVKEVELPLAHRATGRTWAGFAHRGRQLRDFVAVYRARR
jgi:glycosyltransferase involved in cell wall biosynthesis